jgi:hypothetical protein
MLQVMADEGVVAPISDYVQLYLNGKFYGLYGMIEKVRCCVTQFLVGQRTYELATVDQSRQLC